MTIKCNKCKIVFDRLNQGEYEDVGMGNTCSKCIHAKEMTKLLKGKIITEVRPMTITEREEEGWERGTFVLVLNDGTVIYPSQDDEGNDSGALFGKMPKGETFYVGYQL